MDNCGGGPPENFDPGRVRKFAHLGLAAGEAHERPDGKAELHAEHDLAADEQRGGLALTIITDDADRRYDREGTRDQSAKPGREPDIEKAFHDDLAGERSG